MASQPSVLQPLAPSSLERGRERRRAAAGAGISMPNHGRKSVTSRRRRAGGRESTRPRRSRAHALPRIRAACSVLRSRQAIVIGPTPPGTGRDRAGDLDGLVEVDVADEAVVGAVDADVDHGRAGLDPVAADHLGRGRPRRSARRRARQTPARSRVREWHDRDRRVGARAAAAPSACRRGSSGPTTTASAPSSCDAGLVEQQHHARRRARPQARRGPSASGPALTGVSPSTSLRGSISPVSSTPSRWSGTGSWQRMPLTAGSALSCCDQRRRPPRAWRRPARRWSKPRIPTSARAFCLSPT